jgi:hypothetical protein
MLKDFSPGNDNSHVVFLIRLAKQVLFVYGPQEDFNEPNSVNHLIGKLDVTAI